jgi:hypothetical protein
MRLVVFPLSIYIYYYMDKLQRPLHPKSYQHVRMTVLTGLLKDGILFEIPSERRKLNLLCFFLILAVMGFLQYIMLFFPLGICSLVFTI